MNTLQKLQQALAILEPAFKMAKSIEDWNSNKEIVSSNLHRIVKEDSEWEGETLQSIFCEEVIPLVSKEMMNDLLIEDLDLMSFLFIENKSTHRRFANKYFDFLISRNKDIKFVCSSVVSSIYKYISSDRIDTFLSLMNTDHSHIGRFGIYQIVANKNLTTEQVVQIAKYDNTTLQNLMNRLTNKQIIELSADAPTWVIADMAKAVKMENYELVEWFRTHSNANVRCSLAKNPNADRGLLTMLTVDSKKSVINAALNALNK